MNLVEVDPDSAIYRITAARYFLNDIRDRCLTLTRINGKEWADPTENPLLVTPFKATGGEDLTLRSLTTNFFGSCWSARPLGTEDDWDGFAHGEPGIRIQSTPRKLLSGFWLSGEDPLASLKYWIGKVIYQGLEEIDAHFEDPDWQKHLDTTNAVLVRTVLRLRANWKNEQEVRFVFDRLGSAWDVRHAKLLPEQEDAPRISLPFDWSEAVVDLYAGPTLQNKELREIRTALSKCKVEGISGEGSEPVH